MAIGAVSRYKLTAEPGICQVTEYLLRAVVRCPG
jgi:hypothetical protein